VAFVERFTHRRILNLESLVQRCNGMSAAGGAAVECSTIAFDNTEDYPALLLRLQGIHILVRCPCRRH
jgi:hypothetical protein